MDAHGIVLKAKAKYHCFNLVTCGVDGIDGDNGVCGERGNDGLESSYASRGGDASNGTNATPGTDGMHATDAKDVTVSIKGTPEEFVVNGTLNKVLNLNVLSPSTENLGVLYIDAHGGNGGKDMSQ